MKYSSLASNNCLAFSIPILFTAHKVIKKVDITSYEVKARVSLPKLHPKNKREQICAKYDIFSLERSVDEISQQLYMYMMIGK